MSEEKMTKEELREDPILTALVRFKVWVERQGTVLTIVLAVALVGVVGYQVMKRAGARSEQQAAILLIDGESQYMNGSPSDALAKFQQAYEQHKGAPSGKVGLLRAADMQLEMGTLPEAQTLYRRFLDTKPKDGLLRSSALRGLAGALESSGQLEEAGRLYKEAASIPESPLRADDLISAGNALLDAGKIPDAEAAFRQVIQEFPDSPRVREAREGLEAVHARSSP